MSNGFFTKQETESKTRPGGRKTSCASCGNYRTCVSPKMKPYGNFRKSIMIVGEAPDRSSDQTGIPFSGKAGRHVKAALADLGIDLEQDCLSTYSILCRPVDENDNDRLPSNSEVDSCRKNILKLIDHYMPKTVILLGIQATYSVVGHRWKKDFGSIEKWRGWTIPDQELFTWLCPVMSPDFKDSGKKDIKAEETIWKADLQRAIEITDVPFPRHREPKIHYIEDLSILDSLTADVIACDFETTGLKPHAKGHRIVSCAVATDENTVYAFAVPKSKLLRQPLVNLLTDNRVAKIAANCKFEHSWALVKLKCEVKNWCFDVMLCSHILDNRTSVTSLKFQTYVNFGIIDYASEITPYFASDDSKDGNSVNKVQELIKTEEGLKKLLTYNALDSIFEMRLAMVQMRSIDFKYLPF